MPLVKDSLWVSFGTDSLYPIQFILVHEGEGAFVQRLIRQLLTG